MGGAPFASLRRRSSTADRSFAAALVTLAVHGPLLAVMAATPRAAPPPPRIPIVCVLRTSSSPAARSFPSPVGGCLRASFDQVKLRRSVPPSFPPLARPMGSPRTVVLDVTIGEDGRVETAGIVVSSGPLFDNACIAAIVQWELEPVTVAGAPVKVCLTVSFTFTFTIER
ncbi:MAG: energy transducer TonB [Acidobacteriota bacterium]